MKTRLLAISVILATALILSGMVAGVQYFFDGGFARDQVAVRHQSLRRLASNLVEVVTEEDNLSVRNWMIAHGPKVTSQVVMQIDNNDDPGSYVRIAALRAIYTLGWVGLSTSRTSAWAHALRKLSVAILRPGRQRTDFVARSYLMEGQLKLAATEYRKIPKSSGALHFFKRYPDLTRVPASR